MKTDPFLLFGLPPTADDATFQARYEALARAFPPDRCPEHFAAIAEAWETLSDPHLRLQEALFADERAIDSPLGSLPLRPPTPMKTPLSRQEMARLLDGREPDGGPP